MHFSYKCGILALFTYFIELEPHDRWIRPHLKNRAWVIVSFGLVFEDSFSGCYVLLVDRLFAVVWAIVVRQPCWWRTICFTRPFVGWIPTSCMPFFFILAQLLLYFLRETTRLSQTILYLRFVKNLSRSYLIWKKM